MENYELKPNEFLLYKGDVLLGTNKKASTQLIFTNINFVFVTKIKKLFSEEEVIVKNYAVADLKFYKNEPQIKVSKKDVEMYFTTGEVEFSFASGAEFKKFYNEALKLFLNKTMFETKVEKVKEKIETINETFDVDIVDATVNVVKKDVSKAVSDGIINAGGKTVKAIGNFFTGKIGKNKKTS